MVLTNYSELHNQTCTITTVSHQFYHTIYHTLVLLKCSLQLITKVFNTVLLKCSLQFY